MTKVLKIIGLTKEALVLTACLTLAILITISYSYVRESQAIDDFSTTYKIEAHLARSEFYAFKRGERGGIYN